MNIIILNPKQTTRSEPESVSSLIEIIKKIKPDADCRASSNLLAWKYADAIIFPSISLHKSNIGESESQLNALAVLLSEQNIPCLAIGESSAFLMEEIHNSKKYRGLGLFKGVSKQLTMKSGWEHVSPKPEYTTADSTHIFSKMKKFKAFFDSQYVCVPEDRKVIAATVENGGKETTCALHKDNVVAVSFLPEKSGDVGRVILKNFVNNLKK